jgi:hypothetical protein
MPQKFVNLDANESVFFARELEHIKAQTYDVKYPELKAIQLIPVSTEAGPGAESITYTQYDEVGMAKVISSYADDLPRADVKGKQFTSSVKSIGDSFGYNIQEIRASAMANKNLPTRKASAARRAMEQKVNTIAWSARSNDGENGGLIGMLYAANVTKGTVTTRGGHVTFATKTAEEILLDLNKAVDDILTLTMGTEIPDTLLLPIAQHSLITSTYRSTTSDLTILEAFLKNRPYITKVEWVAELHNVNPVPSTLVAANTDVMIAYKRSPDKLTLEIPQPFEQLEVERRGLEYVTMCHERIGGVIVYYPLSINIVEGI